MESGQIIWIIGGIVVIGIIIAYFVAVEMPRRRSRKLRQEFGPEYDRAVGRHGDRTKAEADLKSRKERVSVLRLRTLSETERNRYQAQWKTIQARFVDEPSASIREADMLVTEVMRARGYLLKDFDTQASDLSVNYPNLAENYRSAHAIFVKNEQGNATTEELRQAVVFFKGVFKELLEEERARRAA
jgi:hypothetical protein